MSVIKTGDYRRKLFESESREFVLKKERDTAVKELLCGNAVKAILLTGSGKSLIFMVFALAREEMLLAKTCVLIIAPLKCIIDEQIAEMVSLNYNVLSDEVLTPVIESLPQFLFCTEERVIEKKFLDTLKGKHMALHEAILAIVTRAFCFGRSSLFRCFFQSISNSSIHACEINKPVLFFVTLHCSYTPQKT